MALKERRPLSPLQREPPQPWAHPGNMTAAAEMSAIIMPPVPAFYALPQSLDDLIGHPVWRVLDQLGLASEPAYPRWEGMRTHMRSMRAQPDEPSALHA